MVGGVPNDLTLSNLSRCVNAEIFVADGAFLIWQVDELVEEQRVFRGHLYQSRVVCHLTLTTTANSASQTPPAHYGIPL